MTNPAHSRGLRKATRDVFQAIVATVAGGGAYILIDLVVGYVSPAWAVVLTVLFKVLVTYAQNSLETAGRIPTMLPSPGLVTHDPGGLVDTAVGTVDAVTDTGTTVVGDVLDTAGDVVGEVTGTVTDLLGGDDDK